MTSLLSFTEIDAYKSLAYSTVGLELDFWSYNSMIRTINSTKPSKASSHLRLGFEVAFSQYDVHIKRHGRTILTG
jgi:LEA14-like dessication related protein